MDTPNNNNKTNHIYTSEEIIKAGTEMEVGETINFFVGPGWDLEHNSILTFKIAEGRHSAEKNGICIVMLQGRYVSIMCLVNN
jgi:hypothetical protein